MAKVKIQKVNKFSPKTKKQIKRHRKNLNKSEKRDFKPHVGQG